MAFLSNNIVIIPSNNDNQILNDLALQRIIHNLTINEQITRLDTEIFIMEEQIRQLEESINLN
jgi:hypothetical protein